jgi:hypothetical protein
MPCMSDIKIPLLKNESGLEIWSEAGMKVDES